MHVATRREDAEEIGLEFDWAEFDDENKFLDEIEISWSAGDAERLRRGRHGRRSVRGRRRRRVGGAVAEPGSRSLSCRRPGPEKWSSIFVTPCRGCFPLPPAGKTSRPTSGSTSSSLKERWPWPT